MPGKFDLGEHLQHTREQVAAWIKAHPFASIIISILATVVVVPTFQAIYEGAVAQVFFSRTWPWLSESLRLPRWLLIFGMLAFLSSLFGAVALLWSMSVRLAKTRALADQHRREVEQRAPHDTRVRMTRLEADLNNAQHHLELLGDYLDLSMDSLSMVTKIAPDLQRDPALIDPTIRRLVASVMRRTAEIYPRASGGCLYLPSDTDPNYLIIFDGFGLDHEVIHEAKWYIGPRDDRPERRTRGIGSFGRKSARNAYLRQPPYCGTAGRAYLERRTLVRHIDAHTLLPRDRDADEYIALPSGRARYVFETFVSVPILDDNRCLGVFCLNSTDPDTFDGDLNLAALQPAARMLLELVRMRRALVETSSVSAAVANKGTAEGPPLPL